MCTHAPQLIDFSFDLDGTRKSNLGPFGNDVFCCEHECNSVAFLNLESDASVEYDSKMVRTGILVYDSTLI